MNEIPRFFVVLYPVMEQRYNDFGSWIRQRLPFRVQKISVDAGFSCPNRDGSIGTGGCVYCDNRTFNPSYCDSSLSITEQLLAGKAFFARKYPEMKYLAYFQAFTNTYAPFHQLQAMYEEALSVPDVVGLVIGTRPDCISDELLDYLQALQESPSSPFILMEYGIESCNDDTLQRIHRGHDFACAEHAVASTARRGILTGGHFILGLPDEDAEESIRQAAIVSNLKLDIVKLHQLQIVKGTPLARTYAATPFHLYSVDEYIHLIARYIQHLRPSLILERFVSQSSANLLIAPRWGLKNHEFTDKLNRYLKENDIRQGQAYPG